MTYEVLSLQAASEALKGGGVVAYPTETFYGLGADALNPDAVGAVYAMKQRPYGLPLPVVIGNMADLDRVAVNMPPLSGALMKTFWPGPLSIIFEASPEVPDLLTAGTGRIAVRFSPHPGTIALCRASKCILTASSANISGNPPAAAPEELDPGLGSLLAGVYISPPAPGGGKPSTIVEILSSGKEEALRVLREGAIGVASIQAAGFTVITPAG